MLRMPVDKLEEGMVLARAIPVPSNPHYSLLKQGVPIFKEIVPRLKEWGIFEVWVRRPGLDMLEEFIDVELESHQLEVYAHVRTTIESLNQNPSVCLKVQDLTRASRGLYKHLREAKCGILVQKLEAYDNYLMSHSTNVCMLSLLLGVKLEPQVIEERHSKPRERAKDLANLALGCLLHDVGKTRVPAAIVNKPGKLTAAEMEIMRRHPTLGYNMLYNEAPATAAQVALNHHQRWDGRGYPRLVDRCSGEELAAMRGKKIHIFSRIATLCDVYDAGTTNRSYSKAKPSVQILHEMRTGFRGAFDPQIEQAFYEIVPPFPLGKMVTLSNGVEAVVVGFDPEFPTRPQVQCFEGHGGAMRGAPSELLDLVNEPDLFVATIDDVDVRPFLASQEEPLLATADEID